MKALADVSSMKNVGQIALLTDMREENVAKTSSGSIVLDSILGGGIPKGRIIEIYGPEGSGKTSIALTALGNVQKKVVLEYSLMLNKLLTLIMLKH